MEMFNIYIPGWVIRPAFFLGVLLGFFIVKRYVFYVVRRLSMRTKTKIDDVFINAADFPIDLLILISAGVLSAKFFPLVSMSEKTIEYCLSGFKAAAIVAVLIFVDRFLKGLIRRYTEKIDLLKATSSFSSGLASIVVYGLGALVLLDSFGVSITPLLASLGVGSLAVALALQPSLENFFAGIQITVDKPIRIGHFVKLDSGEEGYIEKIGWRSTWIRLLPNNIIVIPNKTLVDSKILNYYYPHKEMSFPVEVSVHYNSDLENVERVTIDEAKRVLQDIQGGVRDFTPLVRFHTFADFSINFTVVLRAHEFTDQYLLKHEFIKRLHKRYAQEGIVIPYPIEAVNYDQEKAFEHGDKFER